MMTSPPDMTLFVKAGDDGKRYGACPFCQRIFMILLVKATDGVDPFQVATVNLAKPPDIFKKLILRHVPALIHGETALDNVDEIVEYLDEKFPSSSLLYNNPDPDIACKNMFQKFCYYIKGASKDSVQLEAELARVDRYLGQTGLKFLCGDHLTHLDCELLPKLHHLRVASKALKSFDIPTNLTNLWAYLGRAYKEDVFVKACPSDQEIIVHWADKPDTPQLSMEARAKMAWDVPTYTLDVPVSL